MLRWLIGMILGEIICKSSNWQHIQRLKITILGANWQLFRLERIAKYAKFSYFILSTQNIKFYWFVMKMKKFLLPIWWYNRGLFPLGNKYFVVFVLNELKKEEKKTEPLPWTVPWLIFISHTWENCLLSSSGILSSEDLVKGWNPSEFLGPKTWGKIVLKASCVRKQFEYHTERKCFL